MASMTFKTRLMVTVVLLSSISTLPCLHLATAFVPITTQQQSSRWQQLPTIGVPTVLRPITSPTDRLQASTSSTPAAASRDSNALTVSLSKRSRFRESLPQIFRKRQQEQQQDDNKNVDELILKTTLPSMINLAVVPIVNSVDTFWVGRLGLALALAGQSAANQASFTIFFMIAFLPNITAPLVAKAVASTKAGSGNNEEAQDRVCESLWLCNFLGIIGTAILVAFPKQVLGGLVLDPAAPAMKYAAPYLRWRALGMVPSLLSATGTAAYRGMLNTVTPLKVSLVTNAINLVLDPLLIFGLGGGAAVGFVGAAMATAVSETVGGLIYLRLLFRRKLVTKAKLWRPPPLKAIIPLLQGGASMLFRQLAINIGFLVATRRAQIMDPSGVSGAAYGIVMQIYSVFLICMLAFQNSAATLVPAALAKEGPNEARQTADRLLSWSSLTGLALGTLQFALLPILVPLFSNLPEVQQAVKGPALIASLIHVVNGPILAGEGVLIGLGSYRDLAVITMGWIGTMVACLKYTPLGKQGSLNGIMWSILLSSLVQQVGVIVHYLKVGPLAVRKMKASMAANNEDVITDPESTAAPSGHDDGDT